MRRLQVIALTTFVLGLITSGCGNKSTKQTASNGNTAPPQNAASYPALPSSTASATSAPQQPAAAAQPNNTAVAQPQGPGSYPAVPTSAPTASAPQQQPAPLQQPPPSYPPNPAAPLQAQAAAPQPQAVIVPAGTRIEVRMIDPIDSAHNTSGQVFRATLAASIRVHGAVLVPAGAPVSVLLAEARSAGRIEGRSELEVRVSRIEFHGHSYAVDSSVYEETGKARGKQTAVRTGVGAAAGAIIGALAGGGKGAAIGSAAGGGVGFGSNAVTHGQQVRISSEALLTFTLRRRLVITG
jgi:hypothetical protein